MAPDPPEALLIGDCCVSGSFPLKLSIALKSPNLDTHPRLGTSLEAGSRI
jgi:hypothetical protein